MGEVESGWQDWNTKVWWLQLIVSFAWAALIVLLWMAWTFGSIAEIEPGNDAAVGFAAILTSGCCGFTWIVGLVPIVLMFAILKR
tara:strand:+ start:350 stop:604 length:255 start_codon:yes stop_codon:yes gene_type:complete